jgi:hypothetical protein
MNSKKAVKALFVSVIASVFAPGLAARGFNYTYADLGYQYYNSDRFDMDAARVDTSFGLLDMMAFRLGYTRGWTDDFPTSEDPSGDPDLNEFRFGLRPHYAITKGLDLYGDLGYFNAKFNGDRSNTDLGWIYGGGMRYQMLKSLELDVGGEYRSGDIDTGFLVINPIVRITKLLSLGLRTSQGKDDRDYFVGLRLNF